MVLTILYGVMKMSDTHTEQVLSLGKIGFIIMAAGHGTRMRSSLNKVLHPVGGLPMVNWVLNAVLDTQPQDGVVVVGPHNADDVAATVSPIRTVLQDAFPGTGGAVRVCRNSFKDFGDGTIVILNSDTPLITSHIITSLVETRIRKKAHMAIMGFRTSDPAGYGRIVVDNADSVHAIVEDKECTAEQRTIDLCYSGIMAVDATVLFDLVDKIDNANAERQYYLTDVIRLATQAGLSVAYAVADAHMLMGCDSKIDLAVAESLFQNDKRRHILANGTLMSAPETVYFAWDTQIGTDVVIEPHVYFGEGVSIGDGAYIRAFSHIEDTRIGNHVTVGPFARLRPGTVLQDNTKIGNFVEVKNATLGQGTKVNHLSYIGDSTLGTDCNIGAGTITCNYDGHNKHHTTMGNNVFVGSNTALVAPITLGDNTLIGAGSVITDDVPSGAVGISRAKQVNKAGLASVLNTRKKHPDPSASGDIPEKPSIFASIFRWVTFSQD